MQPNLHYPRRGTPIALNPEDASGPAIGDMPTSHQWYRMTVCLRHKPDMFRYCDTQAQAAGQLAMQINVKGVSLHALREIARVIKMDFLLGLPETHQKRTLEDGRTDQPKPSEGG